jgi:Family of unknown function (DUF6221)
MEGLSMDLAEFLTARLDDEERNARHAAALWADTHFTIAPGSLVITEFHRTHDPARVLREVEAKRKILTQWQKSAADPRDIRLINVEELKGNLSLMWALRLLAAVYEDHPDYDPAWKD